MQIKAYLLGWFKESKESWIKLLDTQDLAQLWETQQKLRNHLSGAPRHASLLQQPYVPNLESGFLTSEREPRRQSLDPVNLSTSGFISHGQKIQKYCEQLQFPPWSWLLFDSSMSLNLLWCFIHPCTRPTPNLTLCLKSQILIIKFNESWLWLILCFKYFSCIISCEIVFVMSILQESKLRQGVGNFLGAQLQCSTGRIVTKLLGPGLCF